MPSIFETPGVGVVPERLGCREGLPGPLVMVHGWVGGILPTISSVHTEEQGLLITVSEPQPHQGPQPVGPPGGISLLVLFPGVAYAWHMLDAFQGAVTGWGSGEVGLPARAFDAQLGTDEHAAQEHGHGTLVLVLPSPGIVWLGQVMVLHVRREDHQHDLAAPQVPVLHARHMLGMQAYARHGQGT